MKGLTRKQIKKEKIEKKPTIGSLSESAVDLILFIIEMTLKNDNF